MSALPEYYFGAPGTPEAAQDRLEWAQRRVRLVALGQVCKGVPYHEEQADDGSMSYLLLPFASQSPDAIAEAARALEAKHGVLRARVAYVDAGGYPLGAEDAPFRVLLATRGNPDYGQDPTQPPWGMAPDRFASVDSLEEAKRVVAQFLRSYDVGGGQWVGGDVWCSGRRLGRIAFNGNYFEADDAKGYGRPVLEFAERLRPAGAALQKLLQPAIGMELPDAAEMSIDCEFPLARFESIRSADEWRAWYASEVEKEPGLGSRTLSPVLDPVIVEAGDDDPRIPNLADERRVGAAFLRGDACINTVVIHANELRLRPSM